MRIAPTFSAYVARQFLLGFAGAFALLCFVAQLVDFVELARRASARDGVSLGLIVELTLLRLPTLGLKIVPFAALFGAMFAYMRLTRSHELVVARAAGVSVWQFLLPALVVALLSGIAALAAIDPIASAMARRFEGVEDRVLGGQGSLSALSPSGLWLREGDGKRQMVIHAGRAADNGLTLGDVVIFIYEGTDRFVERVDAPRAQLEDGAWRLTDALITVPDQPPRTEAQIDLPTTLTQASIQESFASPESLSFWALPQFIATLEAAGFSATRHKLRWHAVLAGPLLLCAMVLIGATFSLRLTRRGGVALLGACGIATGFLLYFLSDVALALGEAGSLPPALAAWSPAMISGLLGLAMLFHLEDG